MPDRSDARIVESPIAATWRSIQHEKAILVGIGPGIAEDDLDELAALADSAGAEPVGRIVQSRSEPDPQFWIGKGKVEELHQLLHTTGAELVVFDEELSPGHLRALEARLGVKVVDRTALILDIFALHAHTREGKAQVELAQLSYLVPRLRGWGEAMSRLGGGIGTRGPGETKLESDRQHIGRRIAKLRRDVKAMQRSRDTQRASRQRSNIPQIAIAGYTNAGKSSLMRRLTGADVIVAEPAVRHARPDDASDRAARRPGSDRVGHGRLRLEAPARPGRGVPLDARGSHLVGHDRARRRRVLGRGRRSDRGGAAGARRDRRGEHARGARAQQDRPAAGVPPGAPRAPLPGVGIRVRRSPAKGSTGCSRRSARRSRPRPSTSAR